MKVEYMGFVESKDKPGYVWFVADECRIESFTSFKHRVDAEKYYNSLPDIHTRYFMQIEVNG